MVEVAEEVMVVVGEVGKMMVVEEIWEGEEMVEVAGEVMVEVEEVGEMMVVEEIGEGEEMVEVAEEVTEEGLAAIEFILSRSHQ